MREHEAWLKIAEELARRRARIGTVNGICFEITLLYVARDITYDMYVRMQARLYRVYRFRAWWRTYFCNSDFFWPEELVAPRIAACHALAAATANEEL